MASYFDKDRLAVRAVLGIAISISVGLFCVSLWFDAFYIDKKAPHAVGPGTALLFGFFSGSLSWYANPLLIGSWITLPHREFRNAGAAFGLIALAVSLWFLLTIGEMIMTGEGGGVDKQIVGVGTGYWLWVCCIAVNAIGGSVAWLLTPRTTGSASAVSGWDSVVT